MPLWIVCLLGLLGAILLFTYLPDPLNWVFGGAVVLIVLVEAFRASRPGRGA